MLWYGVVEKEMEFRSVKQREKRANDDEIVSMTRQYGAIY